MGRDPKSVQFDIGETGTLLGRFNTHNKYIAKSKTLSEAAKPGPFKSTTKWTDWVHAFLNYLKTIPGRDGVPLAYVCRTNSTPDPTPHPDFLEMYIKMAPLQGDTYLINKAEVHTLIVNFIVGNETAEAKIQTHSQSNNGREDFLAMKSHYAGTGVFAFDVTKAEKIIESLYYHGERKPAMWWDEFEKQLMWFFNTMDMTEGRQIHSDAMKIQMLIKKTRATFLVAVKSSINVELSKTPMTFTYKEALSSFRNTMNQLRPPELNSHSRHRRHINEQIQGRGHGRGHGRGQGRGRGRNRPGRYSGGQGRYLQDNWARSRADSTWITLTNGQRIEYHPSYTYDRNTLLLFSNADRETLRRQREEYRRCRTNSDQSVLSIQT